MDISETPTCLYCHVIETIEHVYIECDNVRQLWNTVHCLNIPCLNSTDLLK